MSTLIPPQSLPVTSQATHSPSCPAIAFQIAGQWLALPSTALLRVVHKSVLNPHGLSETLAYLGTHPLAILNLHPVLVNVHRDYQDVQHPSAQITSPSNPPFLVIAAVETAMVGIPVNHLPTLLDIPLATTHALHPNYYNAIQGIASHGLTVPHLGAVLLLNLDAVLSLVIS